MLERTLPDRTPIVSSRLSERRAAYARKQTGTYYERWRRLAAVQDRRIAAGRVSILQSRATPRGAYCDLVPPEGAYPEDRA